MRHPGEVLTRKPSSSNTSGTSRTRVTRTSSTSTSGTCGTRSIAPSETIRSGPCAGPATGSSRRPADASAHSRDARLGGAHSDRPRCDRHFRLLAAPSRPATVDGHHASVQGRHGSSGRGAHWFLPGSNRKTRSRNSSRPTDRSWSLRAPFRGRHPSFRMGSRRPHTSNAKPSRSTTRSFPPACSRCRWRTVTCSSLGRRSTTRSRCWRDWRRLLRSEGRSPWPS